jgi:hypothetical protein
MKAAITVQSLKFRLDCPIFWIPNKASGCDLLISLPIFEYLRSFPQHYNNNSECCICVYITIWTKSPEQIFVKVSQPCTLVARMQGLGTRRPFKKNRHRRLFLILNSIQLSPAKLNAKVATRSCAKVDHFAEGAPLHRIWQALPVPI